MSHWITRNTELGENILKKSDVIVQTVTDINMEEIKQNTEVTLKNLEQEHNKEYIKTNFESDETPI